MNDKYRRSPRKQVWIGFVLILPLVFALLVQLLPSSFQLKSISAAAQGSITIYLPLVSKSEVLARPIVGGDWTQEGRDAQHTGFIGEEPGQPWSVAWTWNGPDSNGGPGGHFYNAPEDARTITGGDFVYVPAGEYGLYALSKDSGSVAWQFNAATLNATPAYDEDTETVLAGSSNGTLYKINAHNGNVLGTYTAGSGLNKAVMLANGYAYVTGDNGSLHKINVGNMASAWVYSAGSPATLPPALSATGIIVFGTADLYVHGVHDSTGIQAWHVKPTSHTPSDVYTYDGYWPVIAEQHGIVFIRLNLGMEALWSGQICGDWGCGVYPASNDAVRSLLLADSGSRQNLFALRLSDGSQAFVPAVGFGGVEGLDSSGAPILENGPMPVVKVLEDGSEVAYIPFRNGQGSPHDGRWDTHLGEMVLDSWTVAGMQAGDLRFIRTYYTTNDITDEQTPLSMAGDTLFIAHWGASMSLRISDRSSSLGITHSNPIQTQTMPTVIRRQASCSNFNPSTHWTSCGLTLYSDGRYWDGPGFWVYWNVLDPPTPPRGAYSEGILPRYTYVADGMIIVEGNGGELLVLRYTPQMP